MEKMMTKKKACVVAVLLLAFYLTIPLWYPSTKADEFQEVKPYAFAELPHGRIYKTVHESCTLYVVEVEQRPNDVKDQFNYSITTGHGCH